MLFPLPAPFLAGPSPLTRLILFSQQVELLGGHPPPRSRLSAPVHAGSQYTYPPHFTPVPPTAPQPREDRDCPFRPWYPPQHSEQEAVVSETDWTALLSGHCGEGVTPEAVGRGLGSSPTLLLSGPLPGVGDGVGRVGGSHHIAFQ